jgi:hypothetical protein
LQDLKGVMEALASIHQQLSLPEPNIGVLEDAVKAFAKHVKSFADDPTTPAPCRYRLKFYDHAILSHIVPMSKTLKTQGLSLSKVSSTFLEANNKVVKSVMQRLPGGGRQKQGSNAHLPLVQALKKCIIIGAVSRPLVYQSLQKHCMMPE